MEAFDGWNWLYVCGKGEIRDCIARAKIIDAKPEEKP